MPLKKRILNVRIFMPSGVVVLDASINMRVRIYKAALAIQNRATVDIFGLSGSLREQLLSQFTAWNQRQVNAGQAPQSWINIEIEAGWLSRPANGQTSTSENKTIVFKGQVALCELISPPPNVGVRITCFTRQIDKTKFVSSPSPDNATFKAYVTWAAGQMGFGSNFTCETSKNDVVISNPARSIFVVAALLIDIQDMYKPDVAAFVDDDFLIVKDRNKIINPSEIVQVSEFIGIPTWTEWGVGFTTLMDPSIKLAKGVQLKSKMNPSLNGDGKGGGKYVMMELDYDLSTRDVPFYVKVNGNPPA